MLRFLNQFIINLYISQCVLFPIVVYYLGFGSPVTVWSGLILLLTGIYCAVLVMIADWKTYK